MVYNNENGSIKVKTNELKMQYDNELNSWGLSF